MTPHDWQDIAPSPAARRVACRVRAAAGEALILVVMSGAIL